MTTAAPCVLVIDDEAQIRKFLDIGLRAEGYEVVLAANAEEGLAKAATRSPDLVILDIGLPDREGHEVLKELRQWTQVPVLMLSVRDAESEKVRALDAVAQPSGRTGARGATLRRRPPGHRPGAARSPPGRRGAPAHAKRVRRARHAAAACRPRGHAAATAA
jgi:two-component system KDP operon response regulator KdpE